MIRIVQISGIVVVKQNDTKIVEKKVEVSTEMLNMSIKEVTNKGLMTL